MKQILFCLGRYGDVISALPIAYESSKRGNSVSLCVSHEFASLLDGVSYVDRITWPGKYEHPQLALNWLRQAYPAAKIINAQAYRHPTDAQRLTPSYQTEAWRLAGNLEEFGMWPTVFDQRSPDRERDLVARHTHDCVDKRIILVGLNSVSSPVRDAAKILAQIQKEFGASYQIIDLSTVKARRLYDLLGLFECAECLVTADTAFLHLARASKVPVVALLSEGNVGRLVNWFGSVPPPTTVASFRYSEATPEKVCLGVRRATVQWVTKWDTIHVTDAHGTEPRHQRARETWKADHTFVQADWGADAPHRSMDNRPFLKDLLDWGRHATARDADVVIWSCSDTIFVPGAFEKIRAHTQLWGACGLRRQETDGRTEPHMGRDAFAFRVDWLREHLSEIPDFVCGSPYFDLVLAAFIRKQRGIPSNKENLHTDIFPCELPTGQILHEPHASSWAGENEHTLSSNLHNRALAKAWCEKEMPTLKL